MMTEYSILSYTMGIFYLPKIMIEKPMTKTLFNTLPTACVRGATRSNVFVASCHGIMH
jgi:hypothetical protein